MKLNEEKESLKDKIELTKAKLKELEGKFEDRVSEHPLQSVAIAFGAGLISGAVLMALLRRRHK